MQPRAHKVKLVEGSFSVMTTPGQRVIAIVSAHQTPLGPMRIVFEIDRSRFLPAGIDPRILDAPSYETSGILGSLKNGITKAAESTYDAAAGVAKTVAMPAVNLAQDAAGHGMQLIAKETPFLPDSIRKSVEDASKLVMRARIGDLAANQFMSTISSAARAGNMAAKTVGNTILDASKLVARAVDAPIQMVTKDIPILNDIVRATSPLHRWDRMATLIQKGDLRGLQRMAVNDLRMAQSAISMVPGIGSGISAGIGAGLAALEGGNSLEIAVHTAYGAIPIPPGIRQITDMAVTTVLALAKNPNNLTQLTIQVARERVPAGFPRQVFDTLMRIVAQRIPIRDMLADEASQLADHFVVQYASAYPSDNDVIPNVFSAMRA